VSDLRPGETTLDLTAATDAGVYFIGRIRTPWTAIGAAPHRGDLDGPVCTIEVFAPFVPALAGIGRHARIEVFYWLHLSRRDLAVLAPAHEGHLRGTLSLRSPVRPNPIGTSIVRLLGIDGGTLRVQGLDCVDGTPLLDLKPERRPG
jgi:tRNA-Thr(GGU) m(6)t(6)A37 methyltransferase TsaA